MQNYTNRRAWLQNQDYSTGFPITINKTETYAETTLETFIEKPPQIMEKIFFNELKDKQRLTEKYCANYHCEAVQSDFGLSVFQQNQVITRNSNGSQ